MDRQPDLPYCVESLAQSSFSAHSRRRIDQRDQRLAGGFLRIQGLSRYCHLDLSIQGDLFGLHHAIDGIIHGLHPGYVRLRPGLPGAPSGSPPYQAPGKPGR